MEAFKKRGEQPHLALGPAGQGADSHSSGVAPSGASINGEEKIRIADLRDLNQNCEVLVIEDELLMSALLGRYLDQQGKPKVKYLTSGWGLFETDLSKIKVAIVDILLPQVTGVDLIKDFRKRFPQLGIVPISGMATDKMKRDLRALLPGGMDLVEKPLRKERFLQAFAKAWEYNHLPVSQGPPPPKEGGEELWTEARTNPNIQVAVMRRKVVRPKGAA